MRARTAECASWLHAGDRSGRASRSLPLAPGAAVLALLSTGSWTVPELLQMSSGPGLLFIPLG